MKKLNRLAENRLIMAEKLSVAAKHWAGGRYPLERYTEGWKKVLFNQFHDIMAGTSIEPAYEDARESYGAALDTAAKGLNAAVQSISWHINIPVEDGMKPVVVFNPNSFPGKFEVEMESPNLKENQILVDEEGKQIPCSRCSRLPPPTEGQGLFLSQIFRDGLPYLPSGDPGDGPCLPLCGKHRYHSGKPLVQNSF